MTVKMIKLNLFIQIKARTSGSCLIERKFSDGKGHSGRTILWEGEVTESVVSESLNSLKRGEAVDEVAVQLVVTVNVVGLVEVDNKQSGSPEIIQTFRFCLKARAFCSCLRTRAFWSWLIGRKFDSLKRGEAVDEIAVQLVVAEDIVSLEGVDDCWILGTY